MEEYPTKIVRKKQPENEAVDESESQTCYTGKEQISDTQISDTHSRLALYFYEKFQSIDGVEKMKYMDVIEIIFSQNNEYRQLYIEILDNEIRKTDLYLKKVKQQRERAFNNEWTIITINGNVYVKKKSDMFAYKSDNLQMPVYMWNGSKWIILVSDPSSLSDILDF
jgi:hypothetical protein